MIDADPRSQRYIDEHAPLCAAKTWTASQAALHACAVLAAFVPFWFWPYGTLVVLSYILALFFLAFIAFRLIAMLAGLFGDPSRRISKRRLLRLDETSLPLYTVLVPLYHEPEVVDSLVDSLAALDYPTEKLDIQMLVEPDDKATLEALRRVDLPDHFRLTYAPKGPPRTKPRVCNEGLARARGEYLVVYDAEDRPEPDQLKKAVIAYRRAPQEVMCLQARLAHYNSRQGIFAQWSAMEYLIWYGFMLPGLQRLRAPVPLGGTSNHFRIQALRALGGWDPFNVTEDCDLGMRIARRGWRVWMLDSTTWEEAVTRSGAWLRQRSRWIKGYWQTWLVHGRSAPVRSFGVWGALGFALLTGASTLTLVVNPMMWAVIAAWLLMGWPLVDIGNPFSQVMLLVSLFLMGGNLVFLGLNMTGCLVRRRPDLVPAALLSPIEWVFLSLAGWLALAQAVARPFHWEKTRHGAAREDSHPRVRSRLLTHVILPCVAFLCLAVACLGAVDLVQERLDEQARAEERERIEKARRIRMHQIVWENFRYGRVQRPNLREADCYEDVEAIWDFASDDGGWYLSEEGRGIPLELDRPTTTSQRTALRVPLQMPGEVDIVVHPDSDWTPYAGLTVQCYLPPDAPKGMQAIFYLRERDDLWYEHLTTQTLLVGKPSRLEIDLDGRFHDWRTHGHARPYDAYTPQRVRTFGLRFLGKEAYDGPVYVEHICPVRREPPQARRRQGLLVEDIRIASPTLAVGSRFEAAFEISRVFANPFDPAVADVRGRFHPPDGAEVVEIPAFYWEGYERSAEEGREVLTPAGRSGWRVRFSPRMAGTWRFQVAVRDADGLSTETQPLAFQVDEGQAVAFLEVAESNPRYYAERDTGAFFYPIGHNVCFPVDKLKAYQYDFPLPWGLKTYYYDEVLDRMAQAGENWVRIWMTPWGFGIEGPPQWSEFHGVGRYNTANAWRLDHVLERAERLGIRVCLTMGHYSEYNQSWRFNQYNKANGGFLDKPFDLFTDPKAVRAFENRLRYVVARWGYSAQIMAWELWGEVNLVPGYVAPPVAQWHKRMAAHLDSLDPFRHMVFTHCHNWQRGHELWQLPEIDIVQGNGYIRPPNRTENHVINFRRYLDEVEQYPKPVLVAEYGGRSERGAPSRDYLTAQMHSGLWASFVHPFGGTAMHWWWNFIHGEDLYGHFEALARFAQGIDRLEHDYREVTPQLERQGRVIQPMAERKDRPARGRHRRPAMARLLDRLFGPGKPRAQEVNVAGMQAADRGFYWVYHPMSFITRTKIPSVSGVTMTVAGLAQGVYRVEFWDTDAGKVYIERDVSCDGGNMRIELPAVEGDLALKVRRRSH